MRKTLLILLAMFVCGSVFADEVEIPFEEGMGGNPYYLVYAADYNSYADDDVTYIYLENQSGEGRNGWGVGQILDQDWTSTVQELNFSGSEAICKLKFTIADFKSWGAPTDGFVMNIFNGVVLNKITVVSSSSIPTTITLDFEADELGTVYPTVGWSSADIAAEVTANPSGSGQSLSVAISNWNSAPRFNTIKFPGDQTLADVESIQFDIYLDASSGDIKWKDINFWFGAEGVIFAADGPTGGVNNLLAEETLGIWIEKEAVMSSFSVPEEVLALNTFDMAMGVNCDSGNKYYLDNITFIGIDGVAIAQVKAAAPMILPTSNGIKVANNGERIMVYGFDGRLVAQTYNSEIALAKGLYIVKVGTTAAQKVLVK